MGCYCMSEKDEKKIYSLIITARDRDSLEEKMYCYDSEKNRFLETEGHDSASKCTLATIDMKTCESESRDVFLAKYGFSPSSVLTVKIFYNHDGLRRLKPIYGNNTILRIASRVKNSQIEVVDGETKTALYEACSEIEGKLSNPISNYRRGLKEYSQLSNLPDEFKNDVDLYLQSCGHEYINYSPNNFLYGSPQTREEMINRLFAKTSYYLPFRRLYHSVVLCKDPDSKEVSLDERPVRPNAVSPSQASIFELVK